MLDTVSMGKRIKEARLKKGLSVEKLAEILDISVVFMSDIERGVKCPRMENFVKILNALEITADEVLFDSVRADTDIYLSKLTSKMKHLDNRQIAKVEKIIDILLSEFC
ncbi:MAG: helix-turn-helix transcriptional regulator [Ruminococcaceae bacterium]|nr:helix-turn-helix transcriptional regulator [Oscillospiraceae bacterium]